MHPIYVMAFVTSFVAIALFGAFTWQLSKGQNRILLLVLGLSGLVMSPAAFYLVRLPAKTAFESRLLQSGWDLEKGSPTLDAIRLTYAPVTEEIAKLLPWAVLLLLGVSLRPTEKRIAPLSMTIGLSFAVGEIWLVAKLLADSPNTPMVAWYAYGGFFGERLMTCFSHALFALPTVWLSRLGLRFVPFGLLAGMTLHYLGNGPIVLMNREAFGIDKSTWMVIVQLWLTLFTVISVVAILSAHLGSEIVKRLWKARMICPECGAEYRQPILMGLNAGLWRYEPCGACKKWHWVSPDNLAPAKPEEANH